MSISGKAVSNNVKAAKKRPASTQEGPARKKQQVAKDENARVTGERKSMSKKQSVSEGKAVQRKRPVTAPVENKSDSENEDSFESENEKESGAGDQVMMVGEDAEMDEGRVEPMQVDGEKQKGTQSARESHKAQKALLQERRSQKQNSALLADAKRCWSQARQKDIKPVVRKKHIQNLMNIVRGKVLEVVSKHDASRIIQTIVKYGGQEDRDQIAVELKGHYKELSQSKYSKFLVTKLIRSCPAHRASILLEFKSHVIRLLLHREASSVIADSYDLYANAYERALLLQDFYGKEVSLFSSAYQKGSSASDTDKSELRKGLKGALVGADAERRKRILAAVKENINIILNNIEKGAVSYHIFHHAFWEYLTEVDGIDDEVEKERLRREAFDGCQEALAEMVHTKDGSRLVRQFLAEGTAKDRKQIIKVLKPHIERICKDDDAQLVLFTALDVIDDTKLTAKSIVSEITSLAPSLYSSPQGRRSLLYLIVPRSTRHFTPAQIAQLAETDPIRARTSKKDATLRMEEIRKAASGSGGLVEKLLEDPGIVEDLLRDPGGSLVVNEVMLHAEGEKQKAIQVLTTLLNSPYPSLDDSNPHIIDVPHSCRSLKIILQGGHYSRKSNSVVRPPPSSAPAFAPVSFASAWMQNVGKTNTQKMAGGGGTFVVAALCETVKEDGDEKMRTELKDWFSAAFVKDLADDVRGRDVLLHAIESL